MVHRVPVPEDTLFLKTYLTTSVHVRRILDALMKCKRAVRFVVFFPWLFFPSDHHASRAQLWSGASLRLQHCPNIPSGVRIASAPVSLACGIYQCLLVASVVVTYVTYIL